MKRIFVELPWEDAGALSDLVFQKDKINPAISGEPMRYPFDSSLVAKTMTLRPFEFGSGGRDYARCEIVFE